MFCRVFNVYRQNDIKTYNDRIYTINKDLIVYNIGYKVCGTKIYTRPTNTVNNVQQADRGISVITPLPMGEGTGEGPVCVVVVGQSVVEEGPVVWLLLVRLCGCCCPVYCCYWPVCCRGGAVFFIINS